MASKRDTSKPAVSQASLHILELVKVLPPAIRELLLPSDFDGFKRYEQRLERLRIRERTRDSVMNLQRRFNLPLRPNAPLSEVVATVRVKLLREEHGSGWQPPQSGDLQG